MTRKLCPELPLPKISGPYHPLWWGSPTCMRLRTKTIQANPPPPPTSKINYQTIFSKINFWKTWVLFVRLILMFWTSGDISSGLSKPEWKQPGFTLRVVTNGTLTYFMICWGLLFLQAMRKMDPLRFALSFSSSWMMRFPSSSNSTGAKHKVNFKETIALPSILFQYSSGFT